MTTLDELCRAMSQAAAEELRAAALEAGIALESVSVTLEAYPTPGPEHRLGAPATTAHHTLELGT